MAPFEMRWLRLDVDGSITAHKQNIFVEKAWTLDIMYGFIGNKLWIAFTWFCSHGSPHGSKDGSTDGSQEGSLDGFPDGFKDNFKDGS